MNTVNFLPASFQQDRQRRRRVRRQWALILLTLLAIAGWYVFASGRQSGLELQALSLEKQADAVQALATQAVQLQEHRALLRQKVRVKQELAQPISHTQVIALLGSLLPERATLTSMVILGRKPNLPDPTAATGRTPTASRAATDPDNLRVSLSVLATNDLDIAAFLSALGTNPLFENVKLLYTRATEVNQSPMRESRIELGIPLERNYRSKSQEVAHAN